MADNTYPTFFHVEEFADFQGVSLDHVRHGAQAYCGEGSPLIRAKLPSGYGAFRWGRQWVIYFEQEADKIAELFRTELT